MLPEGEKNFHLTRISAQTWSRGLLKPLGSPPRNSVKYFVAADLEELKADRRWRARATEAIHHHWRSRNTRRKTIFTNGSSANSAA